jgi:hypothetical protein
MQTRDGSVLSRRHRCETTVATEDGATGERMGVREGFALQARIDVQNLSVRSRYQSALSRQPGQCRMQVASAV